MLALVIILVIALIVTITLYSLQRARIIARNIETERANKILEEQNEELEKQEALLLQNISKQQYTLDNLIASVRDYESALSSLKTSAETMRESAEERAQSVYEARLAELNSALAQVKMEKEEQISRDSRLLMEQLKKTEGKVKAAESRLADLEAKQLAYIQAQQRELEMEGKRDYYRLVISDEDLREAKSLRELQMTFSHKDVVDKVIWETYYKPAYDTLMPHIFENKTKVSGIYKITNMETGQPYIGQSVKRWPMKNFSQQLLGVA